MTPAEEKSQIAEEVGELKGVVSGLGKSVDGVRDAFGQFRTDVASQISRLEGRINGVETLQRARDLDEARRAGAAEAAAAARQKVTNRLKAVAQWSGWAVTFVLTVLAVLNQLGL